MTFFGLPDLTASACASKSPSPKPEPQPPAHPDAAASEPAIAPVADVPFDPPIAPAVALPFDPPFATEAAPRRRDFEAVTTCSIDPSHDHARPVDTGARVADLQRIGRSFRKLLRISCSHASEFL